MTTTSPSSPLPSTASTLWAHLLHRNGPSKSNATQLPSYAQLTPQDKAGTSTRILLHDTHARLEKFSERANSIFSELEASKREMIRVREEVESAREKEFEDIAHLSAFSFAHICWLSLTLTSERLHALEDKINSRLDALTALLQTQNQLSQSLQEQFSRAQNQQSRILELLAPLHPILQSVPLHIDIARNAIMEKIPEGSTPSRTPSSEENAEPPFPTRKRRRVNVDTPQTDLHKHPMLGYQDRPTAVEERPRPQGLVRRPAETQTSAVQAPSGEKSDDGRSAVACRSFGKSQSGSSGAAALATTLSTISTTPPRGVGRKDQRCSFISSRFPTATVPGKRFILIDDDDDDDDDDDL
ncbi:hypothetical protein BJV78DRAFT_1282703 [Lactifluus subvellereus]|nr:hypothetical protein BJV78DRAFT_1282703 [Lactifluus subvellereus]